MKDLVENRKHISFGKKLSLAGLVLKENGVLWCSCLGVYYATSSVGQLAFRWMDGLRRRWSLPGMNSPALNKAIWEAWDWSAGGEEWTPSEDWKESLLRSVLEKHVARGGVILEIGPGGGRWTGVLIERSQRYVGVDISATCVEVCQKKFGSDSRASFQVGSGTDLKGIDDSSIDTLWSFDVFVHINRREVEGYADEFRRVLKPGGVGIIHHGSVGGALGGWRSNLTHEGMLELLKARGFEIVDSCKEWTDNGVVHQAGLYQDVITVFRRVA